MDFDAGQDSHEDNHWAPRFLRRVRSFQNRPRGGMRFEDNVMVFHQKDRQILPSHLNQPLYYTSYIHDMELKHAFVNPNSSSNIIPLSKLKVVGIPQGRIVD